MRFARAPQKRWLLPSSLFADSGSTTGRFGQKAVRPRRVRAAGRNVIDARNDAAIPMAATGPSPRLELRSDNRRHSTPAITVPAEAATGSRVARHAALIAVYLSSVNRSSSR